VEPNHWVYPLYDADFSRRLVYEAAVTRNTLTLMRRRGWTYLFLDPLVPGAAKLLEEPLRAGSLERLTPSLYRRK
jgi:hypothetical protein